MIKISALVSTVLLLASTSTNLLAGVSQAEADKLGKSLTPFGSIKEANNYKTIPAWTGGITKMPEGFEGNGFPHVDPFADDEIKFSIKGGNYEEYKKKLTPGQYKMFETYPDTFAINVYPTRRSHSMPDWIMENTRKNAVTAKLTKAGSGFSDAYGGIPFPILHGSSEEKALQAMWNHMTRWRGIFVIKSSTEASVQRSGAFTPITKQYEILFNFHTPGGNFEDLNNILFYFLAFNKAPARLAGGALLVHETLDQLKEERQVWDYNKGQRRVRRAPNLAYDSPIASSDNTRTADDTDMYNGAPDRYNWEYVGLEERFIPYNNYRIDAAGVKYDDLVMKGHLNPDYIRWELHRVHVVRAKLKEGIRHIYKERVYYIDEDSWGIALVDQYDQYDQLWRVSTALTKNYYELPGTWAGVNVYHDLDAQRYSANGLSSEERRAVIFEDESPGSRHFKPASLRRRSQ
jgi:Protein of unknown function (DUF1329)